MEGVAEAAHGPVGVGGDGGGIVHVGSWPYRHVHLYLAMYVFTDGHVYQCDTKD